MPRHILIIEDNPAQPRYVLTVWGVGYKFMEHDSQRA